MTRSWGYKKHGPKGGKNGEVYSELRYFEIKCLEKFRESVIPLKFIYDRGNMVCAKETPGKGKKRKLGYQAINLQSHAD